MERENKRLLKMECEYIIKMQMFYDNIQEVRSRESLMLKILDSMCFLFSFFKKCFFFKKYARQDVLMRIKGCFYFRVKSASMMQNQVLLGIMVI